MAAHPEAHPPSEAGGLVIQSLTAADAILAAVPDLARLRIGVFREFPYLYDGSLDYERDYLADYASTEGAIESTGAVLV